MEQFAWIFWLVIGIGLLVAEIFTLSFFLFWFGIGALAAAFVGVLGFGFVWQFAAFAIVSTAFTILSRSIFANRFLSSEESEKKMGLEALPGKIGTVTEASKGSLNAAAVRVYGSEWTAYPVDSETLLIEGEKVEVVRIEGASIYVQKVQNELPGWKQD
jgi:membrane protein implicated in regulation of membrane protease activity